MKTYSVRGPKGRWVITEYSGGSVMRVRTFTNWFVLEAAIFALWASGSRRVL